MLQFCNFLDNIKLSLKKKNKGKCDVHIYILLSMHMVQFLYFTFLSDNEVEISSRN